MRPLNKNANGADNESKVQHAVLKNLKYGSYLILIVNLSTVVS